jgi:hypothetical protein
VLRLAVTVLPKQVWTAVEQALGAVAIGVLGLQTMESCLALAAAGRENAAVLECSTGRARFVLCSGDAPVQVRRFILGGGGEAGSEAIVAQLALELPRTYDWLRESGKPQPQVLVVGSRIGLDEDSTAMLGGDIDGVERPPVECVVASGDVEPGLASLMLLHAVCRGKAIPSLLEPPAVRIPWGRRPIAALAAGALAGAALTWCAVADLRAMRDVQAEVQTVGGNARQVESQLANAEAAAAPFVETAAAARRLHAVLGQRVPASRLVAEVSNCAADGIHIEGLQFASTEKVMVAGIVEGPTRKSALETLAGFVDRLRTLPYLVADGQDEVTEVSGSPNRLRFRLVRSWSKR